MIEVQQIHVNMAVVHSLELRHNWFLCFVISTSEGLALSYLLANFAWQLLMHSIHLAKIANNSWKLKFKMI